MLCRASRGAAVRAGAPCSRLRVRGEIPVPERGGNYFRTENASQKFDQINGYVHMRLMKRLMKLMARKGGRSGGRRFDPGQWPHRRFVGEHGLYNVLGTIRYPGGAHVA